MVYHLMLINALPASTVTLSETVLVTFTSRFSCTFGIKTADEEYGYQQEQEKSGVCVTRKLWQVNIKNMGVRNWRPKSQDRKHCRTILEEAKVHREL
jgi:hypothetical protein